MGKFNIGDSVAYIGEAEMTFSQRDLPLKLTLKKGMTLTVDEIVETKTGYILRFKEIVPWLPEALFRK